MPVVQHRHGSGRSADPRTRPFTREAWVDKSRELPPNVVDFPAATPDMMLVALRPYRDWPEVREHMRLLDGIRHRRTF